MPSRLNINESFICRIWEGGNYYYANLFTTCGKAVEVTEFGRRNIEGGPDYLDALIKINGVNYRGDVEIHRDLKGWSEHLHKGDRKYNSVILQVVMWDIGVPQYPVVIKGRKIFTVVLSKFLIRSVKIIWQEIISNPSEKFSLPCYNLNSNISTSEKQPWVERLSNERLKLKTKRFLERLKEIIIENEHRDVSEQDYSKRKYWDQLLLEFTFEALGYSVNKETMLKLSRSISISKLKNLLSENLWSPIMQLQSLYFGISGLLYNLKYKDEYITAVKKNWEEFSRRFIYQTVEPAEWQFFRLRPRNFPTVRIAYGAHFTFKILKEDLFKNLVNLFKAGLRPNSIFKEITSLISVDNDKYWSTHYNFGRKTKLHHGLIGKERLTDITINVIIPIINLYADIFNIEVINNHLTGFYNNFKITSKNSVVKMMYSQLHLSDDSTLNTPAGEQGLIHLYNFFCIRERCSECGIGKMVFKQGGYEYKIIYY
jgi:hypothetical protein